MEGLVLGDKRAFHAIFVNYYADLVMFAGSFIQQKDVCEDIVQDVFLKLIDSHESIQIRTSLKSYLLGMVHNRCLGFIEHGKVEKHFIEYSLRHPMSDSQWDDYVLYSDFSEHLDRAMSILSEKERNIFERCLINGDKPKDVSAQMSIPLRTVQHNLRQATMKLSSFFKGIGLVMLVVIVFNIFVR